MTDREKGKVRCGSCMSRLGTKRQKLKLLFSHESTLFILMTCMTHGSLDISDDVGLIKEVALGRDGDQRLKLLCASSATMISPSIDTRATLITLSSALVLLALYLEKRSRSVNGSGAIASVDRLQGPRSTSWLMGYFPAFFKNRPQDVHLDLTRKFGLACRVKSVFNEDVLYLADPKGLQHVLNTSGYNFHKREIAKLNTLFLGKNLLGVEGEEHARQRRILLPSFSQSHLHDIVPSFVQVTSKLTEQWRDMIANKEGKGIDVNMWTWLSNLTLDAFGQGVLSHDFGALSDKPTKYAESVRSLVVDMLENRTDTQLMVGVALGRVPAFIGRFLLSSSVSAGSRFEQFLTASNEICASIIKREKEAIALGKPASKDLLSILVRANMDLDHKIRFSDDELMSQMLAFTIAGHDTTALQLQWVFYELARHPEVQVKIREEVKAMKEGRGVQELGPSEFESLTYTVAVVKETLRFHPMALFTPRRSARDDIIPLACPVTDVSGKEVHSVQVRKGQQVFVSFVGYNYVKDLWGDDADEWIPERFLEEREVERSKRTLGVYAHVATFSSGVHSCIAWRFALLEMLAIIVGLVENFEFSMTASNPVILKRVATNVYPSVEGEEGAQLPLLVKPVLE